MKPKVLRPDGSKYTTLHLEMAFKAYKNEKKHFLKSQNKQYKNLNNSLKFLNNSLKKRCKNTTDGFPDEWDFHNINQFNKNLKNIFQKKQKQELNLFNKHLKEMYKPYFNPILDGKWELETSDIVIKEAIKQEKKKIINEKNLRKQQLKKESKKDKNYMPMEFGYCPPKITNSF